MAVPMRDEESGNRPRPGSYSARDMSVLEGLEPVRKYTVADSPTWAHPLILPAGIVIKDATTLALWSW